MRYLKFICVALLFCYIGYKGIGLYTGNFSKKAITNEFPNHGPKPQKPTEELKGRLQQTFYYLSRGHQTYAFIGEDGTTVIKFFNFSQLELPLWLSVLPQIEPVKRYQQRKIKGYQHRLKRLFNGHQIAEDSTGHLYGFIYQHLDVSEGYFEDSLDVVDAIGIHHTIPLDQVVFVVQEKATIARELFSRLLAKDNIDEAKERIDQLFDLFHLEIQQGIMDKDPNVIDNVGFVDDRAIRIDVGRLRNNFTNEDVTVQVEKIKKKFYRWVNKYYPGHEKEISDYLETKKEHIYTEVNSKVGFWQRESSRD